MPIYGNQWFKDEAEYKRSKSSSAMRTTTGTIPEVSGLRRGFIGNTRGRTHGPVSDMKVIRPNGDVYIVRGTTRRTYGTRTKPKMSVDMINALDAAARRKSYARNFAPIGDVN